MQVEVVKATTEQKLVMKKYILLFILIFAQFTKVMSIPLSFDLSKNQYLSLLVEGIPINIVHANKKQTGDLSMAIILKEVSLNEVEINTLAKNLTASNILTGIVHNREKIDFDVLKKIINSTKDILRKKHKINISKIAIIGRNVKLDHYPIVNILSDSDTLTEDEVVTRVHPMLIVSSKNYHVPWKYVEKVMQININENKESLTNKLSYWLKINLINCPKGFIKTSSGIFTDVVCHPYPKKIVDGILFPFHPSHPVFCSQGNLSEFPRSHFFKNTMYALDLASDVNSKAGEIHASFDGIAYVYDKCVPFPDKQILDTCGYGYGNYVYLLRKDGIYALYAHLEKIYVKNKQKIKQGQVIGLEGNSGMAGARHLHFSIYSFNSNLKTFDIHSRGIPLPFILKIKKDISGQGMMISSVEFTSNFSKFFYGDWD